MTAVRITEQNIFTVLNVGSWLLLALMTLFGFLFRSPRFAAGIAMGGLLAIVNYYWLHSVLKRLLSVRPENPGRFVQLRYLLRLSIIGVTVYLLIVRGGIDVIGLLVGLSVIVMSVVALALYMLITKGD